MAAGEGDRHRDFTTRFRAYMVHMVLVVTESPVSDTFEAFSRMQTVGFISSVSTLEAEVEQTSRGRAE